MDLDTDLFCNQSSQAEVVLLANGDFVCFTYDVGAMGRVYRRQANTYQSTATNLPAVQNRYNELTALDVTGDSQLDILALGPSADIYRIENGSLILGATLSGLSSGSAVLDHDCAMGSDLVIGANSSTGGSTLYLNDGFGQFPMRTTVSPQRARPIGAADFDADGRWDVMLHDQASTGEMLQIYPGF